MKYFISCTIIFKNIPISIVIFFTENKKLNEQGASSNWRTKIQRIG